MSKIKKEKVISEQEDVGSNPDPEVIKETEKGGAEEKPFYTAPMRIGSPVSSGIQPDKSETNNSSTINFSQRAYGNLSTLRHHNYNKSIQPKLRTGQSNHKYEQEADSAAEQISGNNSVERYALSGIEPVIQRSPDKTTTSQTAEPVAEKTPSEAASPTPGFIVEDSLTELTPGQMRKSEFLSQLRSSLCSTAESALSGTLWSAVGCPWIDHWFGYYSKRNSQEIERAIRRYAPDASGVTSASGYIPIISGRVRKAIDAWKTTGVVTGVPEGMSAGLPGAGGIAGIGSSLLKGAGSIVSGIGGLFFKGRDGGAKGGADPRVIQSQLGSGSPLDSGVKSRMEGAFGQDFANVRVHTDSKDAQLSNDLNARAFTVGQDIAFSQGEYKPGTLIGDALIAHELAHTVQQGGGSPSSEPMQKGDTGHGPLEEDADMSAMGAVVSMWGGIEGGAREIARNAIPRLRTGLRLSGCKKTSSQKPKSQGVHHDRGDVSLTISEIADISGDLKKSYPSMTFDEEANKKEVMSNLETINAGGVYVFVGHGAFRKKTDKTAVGINPKSGGTVLGKELEKSVGGDSDPPTMVVLGSCGSSSLLQNLLDGGVPVAVGFSRKLSNTKAVSAVNVFMEALASGKSFAVARNEAEKKAHQHLPGERLTGAMIMPTDVLVIIKFAEGYNASMKLSDARNKHKGK